jgi:DHA1 family multidrug resistance protein-like MFS transporter
VIGRRPRSPYLAYFAVSASLSLGYGSVYTLLADLRDTYGFSESDLGLIAAAGFFAGFAAQISLARFADRGHAAAMVRTGVAVAVVAMVLTSVATALWAFVTARLLLGLGSGMVGPALRRIVITRDPDRVGANLGTMAAFDVSGFVLGPILAAVLAEAFGLRSPFVALAGLYVVIGVVAVRLDLSSEPGRQPPRVLRDLLARPAMQSGLAAAIAFYVTIGMFEAVWSVLLRDRGAQTWLIGLTLSLFTVPMIVLAPTGGRKAQELGPLRVVVVSVAIAAVCTAGYGWVTPLWGLIVLSGVHAGADAFTMPANQVAIALAAPREQAAAAQGLFGAIGLATAGAVGLAAGAVYEHAGPRVLFTGTSLVMVAFLAVAVLRGEALRRPVGAAAVAEAEAD